MASATGSQDTSNSHDFSALIQKNYSPDQPQAYSNGPVQRNSIRIDVPEQQQVQQIQSQYVMPTYQQVQPIPSSRMAASGGASFGIPSSLQIGAWVPQQRADLIRRTGVDPEILEMQQLDAYARAHPEAQADTMRKYYDVMNRWNAKGGQYQQEARDLTEQAMKNDARQLYNNNPGPGSGGFGLAQQIAGATLANQSQAILGARLGNLMMPAGNALETLQQMGLPVSQGLAQYASSSDYLNQWAYNPDTVYDPASFGFGYNSMGIGGNNTAPTAYGGDGHQAAVQDWLSERAGQLSQGNADRWSQVMRNYTGQRFIGGGPNIISTGVDVQNRPGGAGPVATPHYDSREYPNPPSARQMSDYELFRERSLKMGNADPGPTPPPGWDKMNPVKNQNRLDPVDYQNRYGTIKNFEPLGAMQPVMGGPVGAPQPVQFGSTLSPEWQMGLENGELFGYGNARPSNPSIGDQAFSHWQTDPYSAGQIDAIIRKRKK